MDWLLILFLFFVITLITAALFCGWAVWAILRFIIRVLSGNAPARPAALTTINVNTNGNGNGHQPPSLPTSASATDLDTVRCARQGCWAHNPTAARFCRRCGAALPSAQPVLVRRAAVW